MSTAEFISVQRRSFEPADRPRSARVLDEAAFRMTLEIEEKRAERSHQRFVLMLVDCSALLGRNGSDNLPGQIAQELVANTRETDLTGWYEQSSITGTIFTDIGTADGRAVTKALLDKVSAVLSQVLSIEHVHHVRLSFHVFPDDWSDDRSETEVLYPENRNASDLELKCKRLLDIGLSSVALIVLSPVFAIIALIVKMTSPGRVLFRQERVGYDGRRFTFLKFRSMYVDNGHEIHEEFVKNLIRGEHRSAAAQDDVKPVYKIVNDPRVTPVGRFLRRSSLDEIPQFINVLRGEMSLVGPRPPVPYEVACYEIWHRRRLVRVKPGITGLWQVKGRSRVGFDEMIRLDLQYARTWSIWLDLKILLQTPRAVIGGAGAY